MPTETAVRSRRLLAVVVAGMVVVASGVGGWWLINNLGKGPTTPSTKADGPTFQQALEAVSGAVANASGGPWALFSVYGVATQTYFSPNLIGYAHTNVTVNSCGQAFNGLTLWNGTIPLFNGTLNSGTAPFWQLAYFSNASQQILLVTDVLGHTRLYSPIAYPSSCMPWYDFPANTTFWSSPAVIPSVDSSEAARVAWSAALERSETVGDWVTRSPPWTEIITFGPGMFMGLGDVSSAYGVYFDRCGEVGITGIQSLVVTDVGSRGQWLGTANLTHNCALINSGVGAYDAEYDLLFSTPSIGSGPTTTSATTGFQVAIAAPNGTLGNFYDEVGLADWMTSWNLTAPSGMPLPLAQPSCRSWVPSVSDCVANTTGWFAVILSATGEWINSYGALPGGGVGWSEPVTALVSHQQLVIVVPSSWNVSGDTMTVASTVSTSSVIGSVSL